MRGWRAALLCAALTLGGCRAPAGAPPRPALPAAQLPVAARVPITPDVSAVPVDAAPVPPRPTEYRHLSAADCRRLAVAGTPFADDLDRHSESAAPSHPHHRKKAARYAEASRLVRGYFADDLRNSTAGDALDEFFKLAQAEGQYDLLVAGETEVRAQLDDALKAERAGLKDRADVPAIRRKLLDLEARRAKLDAAVSALNASLRARLALAPGDALPLWPADPLAVPADDADVEAAVATGLHYRPDLNALRVLADGNAADLAEGVLKSINPLLGKLASDNPWVALFAPILAPFTGKPERREAETTERVRAVLAARERQAEAEIRAAAALRRGARFAVAARALDVKQVDTRIAELRKREAAGLNVTADLVTAKLDLLTAKGDLLTAATEWHAADAKLRLAMGVLVRE
ncbi:MAG: TolC family protein [Planctomycetes bacterium]|nr:TolC family protein [Planctomycetota bacterium]